MCRTGLSPCDRLNVRTRERAHRTRPGTHLKSTHERRALVRARRRYQPGPRRTWQRRSAFSWRHDRLMDSVLEVLAKCAAGTALNEIDRHDLLGRFDPEAHPGAARPPVCALRHAQIGGNRILHDLHAEAESHAVCRTAELSIDHLAGVIAYHQLHRARTEEPPAVQLPFVEHHLRELQIVLGGTHQATGTREIHVRDSLIAWPQTLRRQLIDCDQP